MPQFYYIKVAFKGVFVTRTCFPDVNIARRVQTSQSLIRLSYLSRIRSMTFNVAVFLTCIPQFYYIKMAFKGVFVTRTCFPDVNIARRVQTSQSLIRLSYLSRIRSMTFNVAVFLTCVSRCIMPV